MPGVYAWGIEVTVVSGQTKQQADTQANEQACLTPDTITNATLFMAQAVRGPANLNGQTTEQCLSRRGGTLDPTLMKPLSMDSLPSDPGLETFKNTTSGKAVAQAVDVTLNLRGEDTVAMPAGLIAE